MSSADQLHALECLVRSFVALNHSSQLARYISNLNRVRIAPCYDDAVQDVALGKDAKQFAGVIDHADGADVFRGHKLRRFLHGCRSLREIRLAVANHVLDQHRICLLLIWLWEAGIIALLLGVRRLAAALLSTASDRGQSGAKRRTPKTKTTKPAPLACGRWTCWKSGGCVSC